MFHVRRDKIQNGASQQIVAVNKQPYSIAPDNPNNWIIISVFAVFTLALLLIVVYLTKTKVNHAEEHYEQMKGRGENGADVDGEIAA